jgi:hypothetical protein
MKEELISFETAKLAKEKGFKEEVYAYYNDCNNLDFAGSEWGEISSFEKDFLFDYNSYKKDPPYDYIFHSAPSQSLLQKWLREKHNIIVEANYNSSFNYFEDKIFCPQFYPAPTEYQKETHSSYETALEFGLKEALKLIK